MKSPRMPQHHALHKLLGLVDKLDKDFYTTMLADISTGPIYTSRVLRFHVLTAEQADHYSQEVVGNKAPGRGRPRVFAECDSCGAFVSCGRFNQHYHKHEVAHDKVAQ